VTDDAIAVVGMACRVPGASTVDTFWRNLLDEVDSVRRWTVEELRAAGVPDGLLADPRYVPAGGYLDGLTTFDAEFFGYPPHEAALIDPQQRLFLELAWEALEDGGYDASTVDTTGVFAGSSPNRYFLTHLVGTLDELIPPGHTPDYLPLRVSYKLGLTGPSVAVQAACASSLVAVCLAAQSLLDYRCDLAIAGGASVSSPAPGGYLARDGGMLAPDGMLRPFDADARGTVYGSGGAAIVLKRLSDVADDEQVQAVLRGWAVTNDGAARAGFAVPGVTGLAAAVVEALACAELTPADIGYIEAHGSGTPLGDAIEVRALAQAFRGTPLDAVALGSVKSNVGNLDAAAGVVSLVKAALAVRHGTIPATLHIGSPHPDLGPFRLATKTQPWPAGPRRAGVTSIGLGGTNAHVIVEQPPLRPPRTVPPGPYPLTVSARTPAALDEAVARLTGYLRQHPEVELADVAYTLAVGRKAFPLTASVSGDRGPVAPARRVSLPTYPFQRTRHWVER